MRDNGGLSFAGTADKHVTVTCAKSTCAPGDWGEIDLYGSSVDAQNVFAYTDVSYGGAGTFGQVWVDSGAGVTLNNASFSHAGTATCDVYQSANTSIIMAQASTYALCPH